MKKLLILSILFLAQGALFAQDSTIVFNAKRQIKLEGGSNFRDLGGYPTEDNKHVKWGAIYRSADVSKLTDKDLITLKNLNLSTVCDFRGPDELKTSPDRLPEGISYINLPAGSENVKLNTNYAMINLDSMMNMSYAKTEHLKAKYKPMFDQLLALNSKKSLMFHCTAGKDRTGMGAALVLSALGVDRKYIVADYSATNVYWKEAGEKMAQMMIQRGMSAKVASSMLAANPKYIETFFQTIDTKYGSMDNFLKNELALDTKKTTKLKRLYLE